MSFKSWRSYQRFSRYLLNQKRFILDEEQSEFINEIKSSALKYGGILPKNSILYRAQLDHTYRKESIRDDKDNIVDYFEVPSPCKESRMKPLRDKAIPGRVNTVGIPVFYCSNSEYVALSECRPWVGSLISLARFELRDNLKVINIAGIVTNNKHYLKEPDSKKKETKVWSDINKAFSFPVTNNSFIDYYVPTQYLSEIFKDMNYQGIVYRSVFSKDIEQYNIALFDLEKVQQLDCRLFECKEITYDYDLVDNGYKVKKD